MLRKGQFLSVPPESAVALTTSVTARVQAAASAPLPAMQALRAADGSPLCVSPVFPAFLCCRRAHISYCSGPWVNNCVGHHNYGHFVRFLLAVDVACSFHLWMITTKALAAMNRFVSL